MKQDNKKCWSCGSFRAYYTKGYCSLLKERNGFCYRHHKIMEKTDSCDNWHCCRLSREKRTRVAVNCIPEIYNKIAAIEQILREDRELEKIKNETTNNNN